MLAARWAAHPAAAELPAAAGAGTSTTTRTWRSSPTSRCPTIWAGPKGGRSEHVGRHGSCAEHAVPRGHRSSFLVPWYLRSPGQAAGRADARRRGTAAGHARVSSRGELDDVEGQDAGGRPPDVQREGRHRCVIRRLRGARHRRRGVVVNNNAPPGTTQEVARPGAREVVEMTQGYGRRSSVGWPRRPATSSASASPTGPSTRRPVEVLPFTRESDFVFGSRTVSTFISAAPTWAGSSGAATGRSPS